MKNEEYKTACNVLLSLEQIVRRSDGWEDSAVEAVHNAIQTAIKALKRVDCIYVKDECSFACGECGYCEAEKGGEEE